MTAAIDAENDFDLSSSKATRIKLRRCTLDEQLKDVVPTLSAGASLSSGSARTDGGKATDSKARELADRLMAFHKRNSQEGRASVVFVGAPSERERGRKPRRVPPPPPRPPADAAALRKRAPSRERGEADEPPAAAPPPPPRSEARAPAGSGPRSPSPPARAPPRGRVDPAGARGARAEVGAPSEDPADGSRRRRREGGVEAESSDPAPAPRPVRVSEFEDGPCGRVGGADSLPSGVDKRGRCVRHPCIQLYKRQLLGGFQLNMEFCPLCEFGASKAELGGSKVDVGEGLSSPFRGKRGEERGRTSAVENGGFRRLRSLERKAAKEQVAEELVPKLERTSSLERRAASILGATNDKERAEDRGRSKSPEPRSKLKRSCSLERKAASMWGAAKKDAEDGGRAGSPERKSAFKRCASLERKAATLVASPGTAAASLLGTPTNASRPKLSLRGTATEQRAVSPDPKSELVHTKTPSSRHSLSGRSSPGTKTRSSIRKLMTESETNKALHLPLSVEKQTASSSILEKGKDRLSLLHSRSRSISRPRVSSDENAPSSKPSHKRSGSGDALTLCTSILTQKFKSKTKFDSTGRCKRHPAIILARKKPFAKGWDTIREFCPFCEEADAEISKKNEAKPRGRGRSPARLQKKASKEKESDDSPAAIDEALPVPCASRVQKMPYMTPWGETGWYSGEVNESGKPQGQGRMRFKTGNVFEGAWIDGYSEEYLEKKKRIKSGFGTNVAPWKQNSSKEGRGNAQPSLEYDAMKPLGSMPVQMPVMYQGQMQYNQWPSQNYPVENGQYWCHGGQAAPEERWEYLVDEYTTMAPTQW